MCVCPMGLLIFIFLFFYSLILSAREQLPFGLGMYAIEFFFFSFALMKLVRQPKLFRGVGLSHLKILIDESI